ncbi:MAG: hypothetical protein HUJ57_06955, partial [Erysipelotrichaceae bacterium]|nr:hypothetical protein [Erysipelotrichaceae bacterium]
MKSIIKALGLSVLTMALLCTTVDPIIRPVSAETSKRWYSIAFHTADETWAGTDGDVDVKIIGSNGETSFHTLEAAKWDDFEQDDYASYSFSDIDVGDIREVVIGEESSWKLDWFQVFGYDRITINEWVEEDIHVDNMAAHKNFTGSGTADDPYVYTMPAGEYYAVAGGEIAVLSGYWDITLAGDIKIPRGYSNVRYFYIPSGSHVTFRGAEGTKPVIDLNGEINFLSRSSCYTGFVVEGELNLSNVAIMNSRFETETHDATGILVDGGKAVIDNILIDNNQGKVCAGILAQNNAVINVTNTEISNCYSFYTGGIRTRTGGVAYIDNCDIHNNKVHNIYGQGGAIGNLNSTMMVTNTYIHDNLSEAYGGGVYYCLTQAGSHMIIGDGTVITGNALRSKDGDTPYGGGIALVGSMDAKGEPLIFSGKVLVYGNNGSDLCLGNEAVVNYTFRYPNHMIAIADDFSPESVIYYTSVCRSDETESWYSQSHLLSPYVTEMNKEVTSNFIYDDDHFRTYVDETGYLKYGPKTSYNVRIIYV